jgi:hypothetical protein
MSVQNINTINENIIKLENALTINLQNGTKCKLFFEKYNKMFFFNPKDLERDQFNCMFSFQGMFEDISSNCLEKWEKEYQDIKIEIALLNSNENEELIKKMHSIQNQIEECKKTMEVFQKGIIQSLQKQPAILLKGEAIFGISPNNIYNGKISECHCSELMNRNNRSSFSRYLTTEIQEKWPEKKQLTIASIGAGSCFHELEIHALMVSKGYKINWILNDPNILPKTAANFEKMIQWITPESTVEIVREKAEQYFTVFKNQVATLPDIFLFIDIDLSIPPQVIKSFQSQVNYPCMFAEFNKMGATDAYDAIKITNINEN